ncbi:MAG: ATPase [Halopseudomonas sp.]
MKIESIEALIEWTKTVHFHLAKTLAEALKTQPEERARELLAYLQPHEVRLGKMVAGFEQQADTKALRTLVYDYALHTPIDIERICDKPYGAMAYDAIAEDVCSTHNQIIDLYRYLLSRSVIPEEQQLLEALLAVEEHETMQVFHQVNRGRDI